MKNLLVNFFVSILGLCFIIGVFYVLYIVPQPEETEVQPQIDPAIVLKIDRLEKQANNNIKVQTYINNIDLYNELIDLDPENVKWYVGLADTYASLGNNGKYRNVCKKIIRTFPNDKTGYKMLINYYAEQENEKRVIATYKSAPANVQADIEFFSVYHEYEWVYKIRSASLNIIGSHNSGKYVYEKYGLYGYKNNNIYSGISAKYTLARPFIEDYAAVYNDGEWFFIDKSGYRALASEILFEDLHSLSEGYAVAKLNGKYGYVDASFNRYSFVYDDATSFLNGVAAVKKGDKWALINREFELITDFVYADVLRDDANICSRQGVIFVRTGSSGYRLIDTSGRSVSDRVYDDAGIFYSKYAAVKLNGKWGFIDTSEKTVIDFIYDGASSFASGIAAVEKDGKWGCINIEGETVLDFEYDYTLITSDNGIVIAEDDDKTRFVMYLKFQ